RPRSIVPSPPRTTARSASFPSTTSTPTRSAMAATCVTAPSRSGPRERTAIRSTDGIGDPLLESGRELGIVSLDEVEDVLMVSLRAGEPRVYDPARLGSGPRQLAGHLSQDAPPDLGVADHAARRFGAAGLELGLDEHERLPPRCAELEHRHERERHREERDVACDQLRSERQLADRARVHALEHGDARIVADLRVKLAVADVERDHPRRTALEQHVREPACRRADVEAVEAGDDDAESVEGIGQLVPRTGDVRRRRLDLELRVVRDLLARLRVPRHPAGHDERLRLRAGLGEPALDEQDVEALLHAGTGAVAGSRPIAHTPGCARITAKHAASISAVAISVSVTRIAAATGPATAEPSGISTNDPRAS